MCLRRVILTAIITTAIQAAAFAPLAAGAPGDDARWRREITLATDAPYDSITVGQRMHVRYTATYPESLLLLPPGELDVGKSRMLSLEWNEGSPAQGRMKTADLVLLPLDLEQVHVPELPFHFLTPAGDTVTVYSQPVEVPVHHLAQMSFPEAEPRPLKPQWEAPPSYAKPLIIAGAALLAALGAFLLWRRRRNRVAPPAPEPVLPADFVALQALGEIERMNLLEEQRFKEYYTLVVDVLRHYLERRYGILTMDRTTDEVVHELAARRVHIETLESLLREADLVKFAKFVPGVEAGLRLMESARDIIVHTTPRPVAVQESVS